MRSAAAAANTLSQRPESQRNQRHAQPHRFRPICGFCRSVERLRQPPYVGCAQCFYDTWRSSHARIG